MGVVATLSDEVIAVEPGESASCSVKVLNDGTVVDSFHLDVLGDAKDWAKASPSEVRVFPGEVATVEIVFSPPREAKIRKGDTTYALRVMSQEDTDHSAIVEGVVNVTAYEEVETELISRTLRASRSARGRVALDNLGNAPVTLRLTGADEEGKLRFRFPRPTVTVDPGTTQVVSYRVKPRNRFLRGEQQNHVYRIQAKGPGVKSEAAGSLVQTAMLAPWMPKAFMLVAAAATVGVVMFPTFFSPAKFTLLGKNASVSSDKEVDPPAPTPGGSDDPNGKNGGAADAKAADPKAGKDAATGGKGPTPTPTPSGGATPAAKDAGDGKQADPPPALAEARPTTVELQANSEPAKAGTYSIKSGDAVPEGEILALSDLKIDNSAGDSGTVQVRRDDQVLYAFDLKDAQKNWYWTQPLTFTKGQTVSLAVNCLNTSGKNCTPTASFSGRTYVSDTATEAAAAGTNFRLTAPAASGKPAEATATPVAKGTVLALSDLNIENLAEDTGTIQIRRGNELLYTFDLKDAKKEQHWTEPLTFKEGEKIVLKVDCTNTGGKKCTPAVAFSGRSYALTP
ncbi:hypothetical protein AB0N09_32760 [Streptomyces erythrochromogenes]|uniref:COG1470 family protein n=1 Tax=Streptomyces erythrochromogenes TaxID=285574 RepID=UPI0034417229